MFDFTVHTRKCLLILCKCRSRQQRFPRFQCMTQRKYDLRRTISTNDMLQFYRLICCNCLFERLISHLWIIFYLLQTVTYCLFDTFRSSQRITVRRKVKAVSVSIYIASMYVLRHFSFLLPVSASKYKNKTLYSTPAQNKYDSDEQEQNDSGNCCRIQKPVCTTNILLFDQSDRITNRWFFI